MKHSVTEAQQIVSMLLGGTSNNVLGVIVDEAITYLSELEDGYEDHDLPIIAAYDNVDSDEPFFECSLNEIRTGATIHTTDRVYISIDTEAYGTTVIVPLVAMGKCEVVIL